MPPQSMEYGSQPPGGMPSGQEGAANASFGYCWSWRGRSLSWTAEYIPWLWRDEVLPVSATPSASLSGTTGQPGPRVPHEPHGGLPLSESFDV